MTAPLYIVPRGEKGYYQLLKGPRSSFFPSFLHPLFVAEPGEGERADHSESTRGRLLFAYTGRPRVILSLLPEAPPRLLYGKSLVSSCFFFCRYIYICMTWACLFVLRENQKQLTLF